VATSTVIADGWGWRFGANPSLGIAGGSFTIAPGERVLLLGPSGSGKSTLLRALAGVLGDDEGEQLGTLTVGGQPAVAARGTVGLVLQDPESQTVAARVGDDVAFGCENLGVPRDEIWPRVRAALDAVNLSVPLGHPTAHLSGGQRQRMALAGALAMCPAILLLDEPTANLDPVGAVDVRDAVVSSVEASRSTLIVVDHNVDLWWHSLDRVLVLDHTGALVVDASMATALREHGELLHSLGVWLPQQLTPEFVTARATSVPLLSTTRLEVGRRSQPAISIDDCEIRSGEFTAVTGLNGAGKTTFVLTMGGLLAPQGGTVNAAPSLAQGVRSAPHRWSSRQLARRIGNVFQSPEHSFVRPSVMGELELALHIAGIRGRFVSERVDELLTRLNLTRHASAHPFTLSGGQKRRLSVGIAVATRPNVLVMDEPTFGQDARTWRELVDLMSELSAHGCAIVAATHDTRLAGRAQNTIELEVRS